MISRLAPKWCCDFLKVVSSSGQTRLCTTSVTTAAFVQESNRSAHCSKQCTQGLVHHEHYTKSSAIANLACFETSAHCFSTSDALKCLSTLQVSTCSPLVICISTRPGHPHFLSIKLIANPLISKRVCSCCCDALGRRWSRCWRHS